MKLDTYFKVNIKKNCYEFLYETSYKNYLQN